MRDADGAARAPTPMSHVGTCRRERGEVGAAVARAAQSPHTGWLHFYPGHLALQKVHFRAMRTDVARGALSTLQGFDPHLTELWAHTVGGTACADRSTAIWSCDPRRRKGAPFGALHMAPPPHAV